MKWSGNTLPNKQKTRKSWQDRIKPVVAPGFNIRRKNKQNKHKNQNKTKQNAHETHKHFPFLCKNRQIWSNFNTFELIWWGNTFWAILHASTGAQLDQTNQIM